MKKSIAYLALLLWLVNCHDSDQNSSKVSRLKNVGERIPTDVAYRWAERYPTSKGSKTQTFGLGASTLEDILTAGEEKLGITFHFALDTHGILHILLIPVEINKSIWESEAVLDINTAQQINKSIAKEWTDNFKLNNPDRTWFHFFGINIFLQMLSDGDLDRIDFVQGIDESGQAQLMLYAWSSIQSSNGRTASEEVTVYDRSSTCPAYCNDYN